MDAVTAELRRSGIPVRLSGQPLRILLALLDRPGELLTREQLREEVWRESTFVDFDNGLNAAMNKLRRALGDSAENPRYIETYPGRGYRFIGTLQVAEEASSAVQAPVVSAAAERSRRWLPWVLGIVAGCAVAGGVIWKVRKLAPSAIPWKLTRVGPDGGASSSPALSADGKLIAYSSDANRNGEEDLYVAQVQGGPPIRLTMDGAGNTSPDFSPDGSRIVFRSKRGGGGIYEMPALGGEAKLLAKDGFDPKFSPDGTEIAFWIGADNVALVIPGNGSIWIVPAAGGTPRRVATEFSSARHPIWSPDGKFLLVMGYASQALSDSSALDWWLVPAGGGPALRTGLYQRLLKAKAQFHDLPSETGSTYPAVAKQGCWVARSNQVIFSTRSGDAANLWETEIDAASGKVSGVFQRITNSAGRETQPTCASGDLVAFTEGTTTRQTWSMPFDLDRAVSLGPAAIVAQGYSQADPALSGNGRFMATTANTSGPLNIWLRDLGSGSESHIANMAEAQRFPVVNAAGTKIAFSVYEKTGKSLYVWSADGALEKVCEVCTRATSWSQDEKSLLTFSESPYEIDRLDVVSHRKTPVLKDAVHGFVYGHFSADDKWISFTVRTDPIHAMIAIAPYTGEGPIPESEWIKIAEVQVEDWANWSPDGNTLYFTSPRDGHTCLWAQRLDPVSHRPLGDAFAVQHFHGNPYFGHVGWSAAGGRLAATLIDSTQNVWVMSR